MYHTLISRQLAVENEGGHAYYDSGNNFMAMVRMDVQLAKIVTHNSQSTTDIIHLGP